MNWLRVYTPENFWPEEYWPWTADPVAAAGLVDLTARPRDFSLTARERDFSLTARERPQ